MDDKVVATPGSAEDSMLTLTEANNSAGPTEQASVSAPAASEQASASAPVASGQASGSGQVSAASGSAQVPASDQPAPDDEVSVMTVVEHLDELRNRLIRCVLYIAFAFGTSLFVTKDVLKLLKAPAGPIEFQVLSLEEPVLVFFKVAFYVGLVIAAPFVLFEICRFVAPGLTKKERKVLAPIVVLSPALFVCGVLFAYTCLLPPMLRFFNSFGMGIAPIHQRLDFYVSLVSSILLYMGLCFQLPVIIFALSFTGLVNSGHLIKIWKYALAAIALIAAVITPDPTAFSMILVMFALIGLYAISVGLLKLFGR